MRKSLLLLKILISISILGLFVSCNDNSQKNQNDGVGQPNKFENKDSDSETVMGIELNKAKDEQINELIKTGKIKYDYGLGLSFKQYYIAYDEYLKGELVFHTFNRGGKDVISSLVVSFTDRRYVDPNSKWENVISPDESSQILSMYIKKYGNGKELIDIDKGYITHYIWKKGKIVIEYIVTNVLPLGTSPNVKGIVEYKYDESFKDQLNKDNSEKI